MPASFISTMAIPVTDRAAALAWHGDGGDDRASTGWTIVQEGRDKMANPDPKV